MIMKTVNNLLHKKTNYEIVPDTNLTYLSASEIAIINNKVAEKNNGKFNQSKVFLWK